MDAQYLQDLADEAIAYSMLVENQTPYQETFKRDKSKIGRNEPCGCGSGIKNKKCCKTN